MEVWFLFCSMSLCVCCLRITCLYVRTLTLGSCACVRERTRMRKIEPELCVCILLLVIRLNRALCIVLYCTLHGMVGVSVLCARQLFCLLFAYFSLSLSFYSSLHSFRILSVDFFFSSFLSCSMDCGYRHFMRRIAARCGNAISFVCVCYCLALVTV